MTLAESTAKGKAMEIQAQELCAGYAADEAVRAVASSGGIVSALLIHLLGSGHSGALVSRIAGGQGIRGITCLARSPREVLDHAGSSYIDTPVAKEAIRLRQEKGPFAVVALPCQVRILRKVMEKDPVLREKLFPIIGLFCRGNVTPSFYDDYLRRIGVRPESVRSIRVRRTHVKGRVVVECHDGTERAVPFLKLNAYRVLGVHARPQCAWCDEHLAAEADISVGDIFLPEYEARAIKHSAFLAHNDRAAGILADMARAGKIVAEHVGMDEYLRRFRKIERFGNRLAPRYVAARLCGLKPPRHGPAGWPNVFHCLAWTSILLHARLSRSRVGRRVIYSLPQPLIVGQALLVKALSRL
jgi:coenzyme F420 hydrogenase subunit beta